MFTPNRKNHATHATPRQTGKTVFYSMLCKTMLSATFTRHYATLWQKPSNGVPSYALQTMRSKQSERGHACGASRSHLLIHNVKEPCAPSLDARESHYGAPSSGFCPAIFRWGQNLMIQIAGNMHPSSRTRMRIRPAAGQSRRTRGPARGADKATGQGPAPGARSRPPQAARREPAAAASRRRD